MRKFATLVAASMLMSLALVVPTTSAEAKVGSSDQVARASRTVCAKGSGSYSGRCWKLLRTRKRVNVVEAIPLENKTRRKRAHMHCSFTRTVSRSVEVGGSVSTSVEAGVFKVVNVNVSATVHRNVSQTASQASEAGGDVNLRPGESVVCQRTFGYVVARVRQTTYNGRHSESKILRARIPAYLGVRIVD